MRLIDADAMREDWLENGENEYMYDTNAFLESIDEQPTIEAVPVVHGKWIAQDEGLTKFKCSRCASQNYGGHEQWTIVKQVDTFFRKNYLRTVA